MSLMNGLSAMGAGIAQFAGTAGIEAQRAQLAQQTAVLADQLATTRESAGRVQAGDIAAKAAGIQQIETAKNLATSEAGANSRNASNNATSASNNAASNATSASNVRATIAGEAARQQVAINAPPDQIKLLRALGVQLPGDAPPSTASVAPVAPVVTGDSEAPKDYSGTANVPLAGVPNLAQGAAPVRMVDPMDNPIVQKMLGYPAAGSEDSLRRSVAADVKTDPAFKYKTAGQQATETELRVNVAKGTMTSPETQDANAAMIASYQIKPPDGFALSRPGAAETMAKVQKFNPNYQESRFPEINKAMSAFGSGKQGDIIRSLDVGIQHLSVLDQAAQNLGNTDVNAVNKIKNTFQQQFGATAPTTFEGLKQIVATEIEKSVAGGIGSAADRDRLMASLDRASSPAQLQSMTDGFRALMAGQLHGLKTQYEHATEFRTGEFAFDTKLGPEATKALGAYGNSATPTTSATAAPTSAPAPAAPDNSLPMDLTGVRPGFTAAPKPSATAPDPIQMARDAIAQGAPRDAVLKRLRDNGIDPSRIMSNRIPGQD